MLKKSIVSFISISLLFVVSRIIAEEEFLGIPILDEQGNETDTYNVNPDPYGEPWVVAPLEVTPEIQAKLDAIPEWEPDKDRALPVPPSINHFREKEFRPIFSQRGGSCSAASGVGYVYSWESNILTGADGQEHRSMYYYPYNFLNGGSTGGIWWMDAWDICEYTGCVREADWPSPLGSETATEWAKTYEAYHNANFDRCSTYYKIDDPGTSEGLEKLKQWMYDHGTGDAKGGVVEFNAGTSFGIQTIPSGSAEAGSKIATQFNGQSTIHAMVFAGYNDSVYYDPDRKGAVLLVNSWGTSFADNGILWVPYHLLTSESYVHCLEVVKHVPRLEFKVKLQGYSKSSSRFTSGFSQSTSATNPDDTQGYGKAFKGNTSTFSGEIGLDCSSFWEEFAQNSATGTFFLESSGSGTIVELYLMIYDNTGVNLLKEIKCDQTNVSIGTTMTIVVEDVVDIDFLTQKATPAVIKMSKVTNKYSIYLPFNEKSEVTVMDTKGRRLASFTAGSKEWHTIPASLQSGVHILTVRNGNKRYVEKLNCIW